jgi:hypothetical protein
LCLIARAPSTVGTDFVCADLVISIIIFDMNDVLYSNDRSVRIAHIARSGDGARCLAAVGVAFEIDVLVLERPPQPF